MCGRFALTAAPQVLRALFLYPEQPNFPPRYNIAPTQPVAVVTGGPQGRAFTLMRWGFLPGFVKDPKDFPLVINIRSETAAEKPSFRNALKRRRALMPADGFYEWHREGRTSTPYLVQTADHGPFAFAALHETWSSPDGSEVDTVALLNTHATGVLATIHPRSPVILSPSDWDRWLDPETPVNDAQALLVPPPDDLLVMRPIGKAVNAVRHDGPHLWDPPAEEPTPSPAPVRRKAAGGGGSGGSQGSLF
jgi:putative SOS response-associated peptidase YedK